MKDDNLGLGAKKGSGQAEGECTGMDAFQGLLGRLNGKSEIAIQQEHKTRKDLQRDLYVDRRWGAMNFVPGGLLVGDQIKEIAVSELKKKTKTANSDSECSSEREQKVAAKQKSKKNRQKSSSEQNERNPKTSMPPNPYLEDSTKELDSNLDIRIAEKAARKQRQLDRRAKKEDKKLRAESHTATQALQEDHSFEVEDKATMALPPAEGQRHAVRRRFIRQKKLATMDPQSLKEVSFIFF